MQGARREQPLVGCDRRATQQIGMHRRSTSVRHSFSEGGMSPYLCDGALSIAFRESAGSDDCWIYDVLGDYKKLITENIQCCGD